MARAGAADAPCPAVDKWHALRTLTAAREAYGLSDRDLAVLQALLSFHPKGELSGGCVVHPSNRTICERLMGMPSSTMRRHLAALVEAGVVIRRDSPNGKRYVKRLGDARMAYGFDLSPLAHRLPEFEAAADRIRARDARLAALRETVMLMRRDLAALAAFGLETCPDAEAHWTASDDLARLTARALRRKLDEAELQEMRDDLARMLTVANTLLTLDDAEETSSCDARNEQHHQSSIKDSQESEQQPMSAEPSQTDGSEDCLRENEGTVTPLTKDVKAVGAKPAPPHERGPSVSAGSLLNCERANTQRVSDGQGASSLREPQTHGDTSQDHLTPKQSKTAPVPLALILDACPEIQSFSQSPIRSWRDLVGFAETLYPMTGISREGWQDAVRSMGQTQAAAVLAAMMERLSEIRSPGAYLRKLAKKATEGQFSCLPMLHALTRRR
ncbi:replication protein C [Salipiger pallidus]|uniref:Replication protein C n=2 Tax=Salipiger pallidus TaxID=1775170 RepID=A0A8J3EHX1_9RHOB|nr:replication protein C [Salipiger pallidus]